MPSIRMFKTWTDEFESLVSGNKQFDFRYRDPRKEDPSISLNDFIIFAEFISEYTGRAVVRQVSYIMRAENIRYEMTVRYQDFDILSLKALPPEGGTGIIKHFFNTGAQLDLPDDLLLQNIEDPDDERQ